MKLSERLDRLAGLTVESPAPHLTGDMKFYVYDTETREAMTEAAELARRVEGAAGVYVNRTYDCNAGEDRGEVLDTVPVSLAGQRVRLVPEDGLGGGRG